MLARACGVPRPLFPKFFSRTRPALKPVFTLSVPALLTRRLAMSTVNAHIQVLGTGANELTPSFFLFTDSRRYLFNCGENLYRYRVEYRPPLSISDIFLTRISWDNIGGFPGLAMHCRDSGVSTINLHGPELVEEVAELTRYFVGRRKITLVTPWGEGGGASDVYEDSNVRIKTVPLCSSNALSSYGGGSGSPDLYPRVKRCKVATGNNSTAAFVCKLSDIAGKFDVVKAKALGLPPGPLYNKLKRGECVTTSEGRVVHPHEVVGPSKTGPVMIVIECPDESYITSVVSNPSLSSESFTVSNQSVPLIVHLSPASVLRDQTFQQWMKSFGSSTNHLVLNKEMCAAEIGLRKFLKIQAPLHLMNPAVFHPLVDSPHPAPNTAVQFDSPLSESVIFGKTMLKFNLKPMHRTGVDATATLKPLVEAYECHLGILSLNKPLLEAINSSRTQAGLEKIVEPPVNSVSDKHLLPEAEDDNPVITFLGTGSASPNSYRNVSGILVQTATCGNLLLDCGEGTLSQIYRCFGREGGDSVVRNISGVFLSHLHGDHHLGLVGVLMKIRELSDGKGEPLIIGPSVCLDWLRFYSDMCQRLAYRSLQCSELEESGAHHAPLPGLDFLTVPVTHCKEAYGVLLKHTSGWSIVYSGDTRPCQELVKAGSGASVLIHEATFEDEMIEDAKFKMHCTFGEALEISSQMKPGFTLMTHFSSRYPRIPSVLMDSRVHSKVGIAMDCMSVRLKELDSLHNDLSAMKEIFHTICIGAEDKDQQIVTSVD